MIKTKRTEGSALIICLVVMLFLSMLGILNFNSSRTELNVSTNVAINNVTYQAAETMINNVVFKEFKNTISLTKMLKLKPSEIYKQCLKDGNLYKYNRHKCRASISMVSETKLNQTSECLAYGNSNQKANCFIITTTGKISALGSINKGAVHVQEVQVNSINLNSNGVYEL